MVSETWLPANNTNTGLVFHDFDFVEMADCIWMIFCIYWRKREWKKKKKTIHGSQVKKLAIIFLSSTLNFQFYLTWLSMLKVIDTNWNHHQTSFSTIIKTSLSQLPTPLAEHIVIRQIIWNASFLNLKVFFIDIALQSFMKNGCIGFNLYIQILCIKHVDHWTTMQSNKGIGRNPQSLHLHPILWEVVDLCHYC